MTKLKSVKEFLVFQKENDSKKEKITMVVLSSGTCGQACGTLEIINRFKKELKRRKLEGKVKLRITGCHGFCEKEPLLVIEPENIFYCSITPDDVPEIITETILNNKIIGRLQYTDPVSGKKILHERDVPFYKMQDRSILSQNKLVDPCQINDYLANNGYSAFVKVLSSMKPDDVIEEIIKSGLRGRGGAGFPTGKKWKYCRLAEGAQKFVICNADEGDPGAYMDRSILEGSPHAVIEGMLIGAFAIGAEQGIIYVRNEYPLAVEHSKIAVRQAEERGFLGKNILGTKFSFDIKVARGAGAFVCGESTALMASLEGKVGEPRPKDIHTTDKGFRDAPTNLNNVETWANVPYIINKGSSWFAQKGTAKSKGTKIFALTGQIKNTGLVEVPMGTTLREIIYNIGGGSVNGKKIKAVQTGGPSGGCLPEKLFDLPVDFEALTEAGSMVGSGGMVVMDETTCMVDLARYFLEFLLDESCGKCVPCKLGLSRMLEIIKDITEGRGTDAQLELLKDTADTVAIASLCALGKTAPNPVLSTIKYFRYEYETHIRDKRCPAGVCRELICYYIDKNNCKGCGVCVNACPYAAISGKKKEVHVINKDKCKKCGVCREHCKFDAIMLD